MLVPNGSKNVRATTAASSAVQSTTSTDSSHDSAAMQEAASVIQDYLSGPVQPPTFNVDYLSGLNIMTVRSANNGEVVFQMPGPAAVRLAQLIKEGVPAATNAIVNETA